MVVEQSEIKNGEASKRCVRCVMPDNYPGIVLDDEGVCNYCRYFDAKWGSWVASAEEHKRCERKVVNIFEAAKRKHRPYDAIIGISGGKDSSYCLYLCKEVYGLNVLTFTKENCFLADEAKKQIDRLVEIFEVPHIYYEDPMSLDLARIFFRKTGNLCTSCELSNFNTTAILAREYDIPLIILGNSSRTEAPVAKSLNPWDTSYFLNVLKGERYRERIRNSFYGRNYLLSEGLRHYLRRSRIVLLPDFVDWDEAHIISLFREKYGYEFGEEHSDCWAHDVVNYLYQIKCGGVHPVVAKNSILVRCGKISRDEALEIISNHDCSGDIPGFERLLEVLDISREEFAIAAAKSPQPYITGFSRLMNFIRHTVRRQKA